MDKFISFFILLFSVMVCGQNNHQAFDNQIKNIKYRGDVNVLVSELTKESNNDMEKARSIYFWITENIDYDYKKFNKGDKTVKFKCKGKRDCAVKRIEFENRFIENVLRKKKGICSGYSMLFKRMCDIAKINCNVVDGYVKKKSQHAGRMGILDHSWNTLLIENQTYYLDLTWGAGYCETDLKTGKLTKFVKERNDFYWLTPVEKFTIDHFPKEPEKILNFEITKEEYLNQPYIENSIIPFIENLIPGEGRLKVNVGDTIRFSFKYEKNIDNIQINTNLKRNPKIYKTNKKNEKVFNDKAFELQEYVFYVRANDVYEFNYVVDSEHLKYIEILFDYNLRLKYVVETTDSDL